MKKSESGYSTQNGSGQGCYHGSCQVCQQGNREDSSKAERIAQKQAVVSDAEIKKVADQFTADLSKLAEEGDVQWLENANQLKVMPQGIRFWSSEGDYEVVVVEQQPQLRMLGFSGGFIGAYGGRDRRGHATGEKFTVALLLFYLSFIL